MPMNNWTPRHLRSTNKPAASQTPGKKKQSNCQASPMDKWRAKAGRSYKHPGYADWLVRKNGTKRGGKVKK